MYLSKIVLKNIRCFRNLELSLDTDDGLIKWLMLVGDNATGKTALLRSIAIGLCDESSAAGLLKESEEGYVRRGALTGTIDIWLRGEAPGGDECRITTTITGHKIRQALDFERVRQDTDPRGDAFPWGEIFACGYGAGRGTSGAGDVAGYTVINAVYNMFNYNEGLQNPELAFRRESDDSTRDKFTAALKSLLMFEKEESIGIPPGLGITVSSPRLGGPHIALRDMADGYKSSFLWLMDFLGWAFSRNPKLDSTKDIVGIVLIDEIEQHLHPKWQRRIVQLLQEQFPRAQFIASTHSPLCAAGLGDINDSDLCRLELLRRNEKHAVCNQELSIERGWRYDQVLTSDAFGVPSRNKKISDMIDKLRALFRNGSQLGVSEEREYRNLLEELEKASVSAAEDEKQRKLQEELRESMDEIKKMLLKRNNTEND